MSLWSVEQDHQNVDRAKRSMRHDFETEWAVNRFTSWAYQEIEWVKSQLNNNKHSERDYHLTMSESIEFQKEAQRSKVFCHQWSSFSSIYWVRWVSNYLEITRYWVTSFYQESFLTKVIHLTQQQSSQVLQVFELIYLHQWRCWINIRQLKNQD